jgi:hypothetical protein
MSIQRFVITRRAARTGVAAAAVFAMMFLWSGGQKPEMAHQTWPGLLTLMVFMIVMSLAIGVFLDWTWPMTTSRWHGAALGFIMGAVVSIVMYFALMPWHFTFLEILLLATINGLALGTPYGAMRWTTPPTKANGSQEPL